MNGQTEYEISRLNYQIQSRVIGLINDLRSVGVPAVIRDLGGYRTTSQQLSLYQSGKGVTSTTKSRHMLGMAFDLDVHGLNRDRIPTWWWNIVGPYAERAYGFTWGGRWKNPYDPGHFQL